MKKPNHSIGNRIRHIPACNSVPQPTAPPSNIQSRRINCFISLSKHRFSRKYSFLKQFYKEFLYKFHENQIKAVMVGMKVLTGSLIYARGLDIRPSFLPPNEHLRCTALALPPVTQRSHQVLRISVRWFKMVNR